MVIRTDLSLHPAPIRQRLSVTITDSEIERALINIHRDFPSLALAELATMAIRHGIDKAKDDLANANGPKELHLDW